MIYIYTIIDIIITILHSSIFILKIIKKHVF